MGHGYDLRITEDCRIARDFFRFLVRSSIAR